MWHEAGKPVFSLKISLRMILLHCFRILIDFFVVIFLLAVTAMIVTGIWHQCKVFLLGMQ